MLWDANKTPLRSLRIYFAPLHSPASHHWQKIMKDSSPLYGDDAPAQQAGVSRAAGAWGRVRRLQLLEDGHGWTKPGDARPNQSLKRTTTRFVIGPAASTATASHSLFPECHAAD